MFFFFIVLMSSNDRSCGKSVHSASVSTAPLSARGLCPTPSIGFSSCRMKYLTCKLHMTICCNIAVEGVPKVFLFYLIKLIFQKFHGNNAFWQFIWPSFYVGYDRNRVIRNCNWILQKTILVLSTGTGIFFNNFGLVLPNMYFKHES